MASATEPAVSGGGRAPEAEHENTKAATAPDNNNNNNNNNNGDASNNDGDRSSEDDNIRDEKAGPGPTKWQKVKAHFWRFKWWYLLALVIILAIMLPLLFKVIIPAIIKNILEGQGLPVKGGGIVALTPGALNISLDTALDCPIPVDIDALDLSLSVPDVEPESPFIGIKFPAMHLKGTVPVSVGPQYQNITNLSQLTLWFNQYFDSETLKLNVEGKPEIHLGALSYGSNLDKTLELPGLNYLKGFGVSNMEFMLKSNDTEFNIKGNLSIPNAGVLTLGLGNHQYNVMAGDVRLGLFNVPNLVLKPGNNTLPFVGKFFFDELVPNLKAILDSQKDALSKGYLQLYTSGNSTKVDGVHIPYIEGVLNKKRIPFQVPVITLLADVLGGVLGADQNSLMDIFGEAIGNSTLFENILDHWDNSTGGANTNNQTTLPRSVMKRQKGSSSWMFNLLRMSVKTKRA